MLLRQSPPLTLSCPTSLWLWLSPREVAEAEIVVLREFCPKLGKLRHRKVHWLVSLRSGPVILARQQEGWNREG